jgi:hypothetical protein
MRQGLRRFVPLAAALVAVLPALAVAAASLWSRPARLSGPGAASLAVASDARGDGVVAWARPGGATAGIEAAIRTPRAWQRVKALGPANLLMARAPAVAMDGQGTAYVGWVGRPDNALHVARHAAGAAWTADVLGDGAGDPALAANAAGAAVAAWLRLGAVEVAARPPGGTWGAPAQIASAGADDVRVAMSAGGEVVVTWRAAGHEQAAIRRPGEEFGPAQELSPAGAGLPRLATDVVGNMVAVWVVAGSPQVVQAAFLPAGATSFGAAATVARRPILSQPDVAVGPGGRAAVTWVSRTVELAERSAAGRWGRARSVSRTGDSIVSPAGVAADARGDLTISWVGSSRSPRRINATQVADRLRGGRLGSPRVLSGAREQDASAVVSALGGRHTGIVAWRSLVPPTGTSVRVALRR